MQLPYSAIEPCVQGNIEADLDAVNILDALDATIVPSSEYRRRETSAWRAKLDAASDNSVTILHAIIEEWRTGCYDEEIAIGWLRACRLLPETVEGDFYDAMSRLAFSEFGPVALPVRVSTPIPTVSSGKPFSPAQSQGGNR